ncbi:MAG TPA: hypothetical protein VJ756_02135 [Terriglobales bacterium]|nr:hypothetical protein [Terriglobales bacterium]
MYQILAAPKVALCGAHKGIDQEHSQADEQNGQRDHHAGSLRYRGGEWQVTPASERLHKTRKELQLS